MRPSLLGFHGVLASILLLRAGGRLPFANPPTPTVGAPAIHATAGHLRRIRLRQAALLGNAVVSGVNRSQLVIGNVNEFLRHPLCDQRVRMMLAH